MSGEAILSAENGGETIGRSGFRLNPTEGAHIAAPDPLAGGEGVAAPPQEPPPALSAFGLDFRSFGLGLGLGLMKNSGVALVPAVCVWVLHARLLVIMEWI